MIKSIHMFRRLSSFCQKIYSTLTLVKSTLYLRLLLFFRFLYTSVLDFHDINLKITCCLMDTLVTTPFSSSSSTSNFPPILCALSTEKSGKSSPILSKSFDSASSRSFGVSPSFTGILSTLRNSLLLYCSISSV